MKWSESIEIDAPAAVVQDAIADEYELMTWSAWPAATGYACSVAGDGRSIGSAVVFRNDAGVEQGRQRLSAVTDRRVEHRLNDRGPVGREMTPEVDLCLDELGPARPCVYLDFRNEVPLPWPVAQIAGRLIVRDVRALHVEDLRLLKAHVERHQGS